ncbi:hypothetical protein L6164_030736 [Bauhinia variegata]|uniref:Uncharacterized protein n=1 Tax=Bauhinia variegata TaxID=167791 RepID=A0ACB9LD89_BAUVA|nr:hypothetical protein L6164_030736 [Bauhinia variegata]
MSTEASLRGKLSKKLKLAVNTSNNSKKGKAQARRKNGLKGDLKTKEFQSGEQGNGWEFDEGKNMKPLGSNGRKKRIYAQAEQKTDGKVKSYLGTSTRASRKAAKKVNSDEFVKENTSDRSMWVSNATSQAKRSSSSKIKITKEKVQLSNAKGKAQGKEMGKIESVMIDDSGNGLSKKHRQHKAELSKGKKQKVVSPLNSTKGKARDKTGLDDDLEMQDDQTKKKKKRVIRIDPYDTSNKRLDDGIVIDGSVKKKKKELEEKPEMSKNAQFRAIQPSPSILSFVEDNLLGRRRLIELKRAGYNIDLSAPLDNVPFSTSSERERIEENIFRNKLEFFAAAKVSSSFPPPNLPEIAFAGRSNVGKSSLLNSLTRQWGVVRVSDKPGLTQTINFFKLGSKLCLVDLPGYGFAYAKEEVKEAWEDLVKEYVSTRVGLRRVCLLIDTKWGMKPRDHELIELMERSQTKYQICLTKTDVVFPIDVARRAMQIEESLKENKSLVQPVMMVSSKTGAGIRSLRTVLSKIARFAKL